MLDKWHKDQALLLEDSMFGLLNLFFMFVVSIKKINGRLPPISHATFHQLKF